MRVIAKLIGFIGLFLASSCAVQPPSAEELTNANFGAPPDQAVAEQYARTFLAQMLKDPDPVIGFTPVEKAWFRVRGKPSRFCWRLLASVNARNGFGGYVGARNWSWFFRGNRCVGAQTPRSSGGAVYYVTVEFDGADGSLDEIASDGSSVESGRDASDDEPAGSANRGRSTLDETETVRPIEGGVLSASDAGVTVAGFDRLELGMSYADAVRAIGEEGQVTLEMVAGSDIVKTFTWKTADGTGAITCTFTSDRLTNRSQFGL